MLCPTNASKYRNKEAFYGDLDRIFNNNKTGDPKLLMGHYNANIEPDNTNIDSIMGNHDFGFNTESTMETIFTKCLKLSRRRTLLRSWFINRNDNLKTQSDRSHSKNIRKTRCNLENLNSLVLTNSVENFCIEQTTNIPLHHGTT